MLKRELTKNLHPVVTFEKKGQTFTGVVKAIRTDVKTQFGLCDLVDLVDENGEINSLFLSASLRLFEWASLINETVTIEYVETVTNPKTKLKYQDFKLYLLDDDEPDNKDK